MKHGDHDQNEINGAFDLGGPAASNETGKAGLLAYLAQLGLGDADLAKVLSLLPASGPAASAEILRRTAPRF